ncbi:MAG TPA: RuvX/YqgF family protein [Spirochaetota bacterium]|nr:RuvX/YqgF family protein [Spirochaetota bacterium]
MSRAEIPASGVLLGIDFGLARVGLARTDALRMLASPLKILHRNGKPDTFVVSTILQEVASSSAVGVVMGWPDEDDPRTESVRTAISGCIGRMEEQGIPVVRVAEAFSSREALELLHATGKRKKPGQFMDDWAAAVILQRYLDAADIYRQL